MKYTTQDKNLNRFLVSINTDPNFYIPAFIDKTSGEVIEGEPVSYGIDDVLCFDVCETDHKYKVFESRRIDFNEFWVRLFTIELPSKTRNYEQVSIRICKLKGFEFCPLILGWGVKIISLGEFEQLKAKYQDFFNKPSPMAKSFVKKQKQINNNQQNLF